MTTTQMMPVIGMTVDVSFESIDVRCDVKDAKTAYGRVRLLITPVNGNGEQWIEQSRVRRIHSVTGSEVVVK